MGIYSLSNLVTAWDCMVPKSISYPNKEDWRGKHKQGRRLNEELHMSSTFNVITGRHNGLSMDPKNPNWSLELSNLKYTSNVCLLLPISLYMMENAVSEISWVRLYIINWKKSHLLKALMIVVRSLYHLEKCLLVMQLLAFHANQRDGTVRALKQQNKIHYLVWTETLVLVQYKSNCLQSFNHN